MVRTAIEEKARGLGSIRAEPTVALGCAEGSVGIAAGDRGDPQPPSPSTAQVYAASSARRLRRPAPELQFLQLVVGEVVDPGLHPLLLGLFLVAQLLFVLVEFVLVPDPVAHGCVLLAPRLGLLDDAVRVRSRLRSRRAGRLVLVERQPVLQQPTRDRRPPGRRSPGTPVTRAPAGGDRPWLARG